jgi:hypothetical protein
MVAERGGRGVENCGHRCVLDLLADRLLGRECRV